MKSIFIFLVFSSLTLNASIVDSIKQSKRIFIAELDYFSNSSLLGRNSNQKYPYLSALILAESRRGWWGSFNVNHLFNAGHLVDEVDLSIGKDFDLTKKLDGYLSYSRYFFHSESPSIRSGLRNNVDLNIGYSWWMYSTLSMMYNFGNTSDDIIFVFNNARSFYVYEVFNSNDHFRFRPRVSLVFGTQRFYETYLAEGPQGGKGKGGGKGKKQSSTVTVTGSKSSSSSFSNFQIKLPLRYTIKAWNIQAAYTYSIPLHGGITAEPFGFVSLSTWIAIK